MSRLAPARLRIRLRLDASYDGTDFSGWAAQPGRRTVAGVLMSALARSSGQHGAVGLTVAGRTDAGVHATGQVCHLDVTRGPAGRTRATAGAQAGRAAAARCTGTRINQVPADVRRPLLRPPSAATSTGSSDAPWGVSRCAGTATPWPGRPLDLAALNEARGRPAWVSTTSPRTAGGRTTRPRCARRPGLDWRRDPDGVLVATVQADAFCQAMVRSLVGAMLVAGDGRRSADWPARC